MSTVIALILVVGTGAVSWFLYEYDNELTIDVPWKFTDGVDYTFPLYTTIAANDYIVVVRNKAAFSERYSSVPADKIFGPFQNDTKLSNGGERIVLQLPEPFEAAILRFDYDDAWYPTTDGGGYSLVIGDATAHRATWDDAESWQASTSIGGSPGQIP